MNVDKKSIYKYLLGIVVCEIVLLWAWIQVAPDIDVSGYSSVTSLLDSSPNSQVASAAIRHSSQHFKFISMVVFCSAVIAILLTARAALSVRKAFKLSPQNLNAPK